jgi:hypothetical protein
VSVGNVFCFAFSLCQLPINAAFSRESLKLSCWQFFYESVASVLFRAEDGEMSKEVMFFGEEICQGLPATFTKEGS